MLVSCTGYPRDDRSSQGAPGRQLDARTTTTRSRPTRVADAGRRADRRLHQDREAELGRRLDRRHDGDPEPRHRRPGTSEGTLCADPTPDAVIRIQRLATTPAADCADYFQQPPIRYGLSGRNQLYDTREGNYPRRRDDRSGSGMRAAASCGYVALDVSEPDEVVCRHDRHDRLRRVEQQRLHRVLLRSSRRPQRGRATTAHVETGEYGFEDFVNSTNVRRRAEQPLDGVPTGRRRHERQRHRRRHYGKVHGEDRRRTWRTASPAIFHPAPPHLTTRATTAGRGAPFTSTNAGNPGIARTNVRSSSVVR